MKKFLAFICTLAMVCGMTACNDDNNNEKHYSVTPTEPPVTEPTTEPPFEPVTIPRENIKPEDFVGKWTPVKIVTNNENAEYIWHDIPMEYLFRLEINGDNTGSMMSCTLERKPVSEEMTTEASTEETTAAETIGTETAETTSAETAETVTEPATEENTEPTISIYDIPDEELFRNDSFTWNAENGRMTLDFGDGKHIYCKIKNGTLMMSDGRGMKIYFTSADEFEDIDYKEFREFADLDPDGYIPVSADFFAKTSELSAEDIVGKWECTFYSADGESFSDEIYGMPLNALFQMEISDDNTLQMRVGGSDEDAEITDYTWEIDGNGQILLYYADDGEFQAVAEMNDGELFIEEGTDAMHYKKVDKFTEFDWDTFADTGA